MIAIVTSEIAVYRRSTGALLFLAPESAAPSSDDADLASLALPDDYDPALYDWDTAACSFVPALDRARARALTAIDAGAEATRARFLTPGAGQAMTYQRKEAEARSRIVDAGAMTPFLDAEAAARGMTVSDLAIEVIGQADAWATIGAAIEGTRMGAKASAAAATTIAAIEAAAAIPWEAFGAA